MAGKAAKGVMGSLVGAGVGGAAYFAAAKLGPKVTFFQGRWWAMPSALIVLGHIGKRWSPESGQAVVGAGGALLAFSYYVTKSGTTTTTPAATPAKGAGYYSTPYLQSSAGAVNQGEAGRNYGDAGALMLGPGRTSAGYTSRNEG